MWRHFFWHFSKVLNLFSSDNSSQYHLQIDSHIILNFLNSLVPISFYNIKPNYFKFIFITTNNLFVASRLTENISSLFLLVPLISKRNRRHIRVNPALTGLYENHRFCFLFHSFKYQPVIKIKYPTSFNVKKRSITDAFD